MHQPPQPTGRLAENVLHFARVLRTAGLPIGTDRIQLALQALQVAGLESRRDFHDTLLACLIARAEHRALFDQAFHIFWRDPDLLGRMMAMLLPRVEGRAAAAKPPPENRRLADALFPPRPSPAGTPPTRPEQLDLQAEMTWSDREVLRHADFETMSAAEWQQAKRAVAQLRPFFERLPTRRMRPAAQARRPDWRATLQAMARHGGELWDVRWRAPRERPAPLVVLADISGSMSRYSRLLLHFAHALALQGPAADVRVFSFVFGTRLTHTTRLLRTRDPDVAVAQVTQAVQDWSGGTRITECLREFNRVWARRVLSAGRSTVLLVTDGLEHGDTAPLRFEMERLHKSCRQLVWLNPLLRYAGFEPRAAGIRAMLPHVDQFVPAHNLASLEQLARLLGGHGIAKPLR